MPCFALGMFTGHFRGRWERMWAGWWLVRSRRCFGGGAGRFVLEGERGEDDGSLLG